MQNNNRRVPMIFLVILALLITASCSKKAVTTTKDPTYGSNQSAASSEPSSTSIQQGDLEQSQTISTTDSGERVMMVMLEDIYFEFDKSTLTPQAKETLVKKAKWLRANKDVSVIIEGHCDERGTNEYNLALGDRRAASTKTFLVDLGIAPSRLTIISYGEEQPLVSGHNEEAWAKNRRAHFGIE
jgi:peptidoglycan-associated lipoprotein